MKKLAKFVFILLFMVIISMGFSFGYQIQKPQPPPGNSDPVPLSLARDIAQVRAVEVFGSPDGIVPGSVIDCADASGKHNMRIFVFKRADCFPDDELILAEIKKGRTYEENIRSNKYPMELETLVAKNDIFKQLRDMRHEIYRPDGTITGYYNKLKREAVRKNVARLRYGINDYVSVYVSASWDCTPVPYIRKSLPPFYYVYDQALLEASKNLNSPGLTISNYYFFGMDGEFFEFSNNGDKIYFDCQTQKICPQAEMDLTLKKIARTQSPPIQNDGELRERIKREWQQAISETELTEMKGK